MATTPNKSKDAPKDETLVTAPVPPGEDPNAELDPEVAARALAQVAENERLEREAAYDDADSDSGE